MAKEKGLSGLDLSRELRGKNEKGEHLWDVMTMRTFLDPPLIDVIRVAQALAWLQNWKEISKIWLKDRVEHTLRIGNDNI